MVLHSEFGQIVFKYSMIKNSIIYRICLFYVKFVKKRQPTTPFSLWLRMLLRRVISYFLAPKNVLCLYYYILGGIILNSILMILQKIGHKNSSIRAKWSWFLLKDLYFSFQTFWKTPGLLSSNKIIFMTDFL